MCGRYSLAKTAKDELGRVGITDAPDIPAKYNIAPGQHLPAVLNDPELNERRALRALEWGLLPHWTKDLSTARRSINARAETIDEKPTFRAAARHHRCLIPADGFYEWAKLGPGGKQPYYIKMKDSRVFFFAGIWESWDGPNGEAIDSCAILTTTPNALTRRIHNRMPVILEGPNAEMWLDCKIQTVAPLKKLFIPFPEGEMTAYPVSPHVNSPANDDENCIARSS